MPTYLPICCNAQVVRVGPWAASAITLTPRPVYLREPSTCCTGQVGRLGPWADLFIPFNPTSGNRTRPSEHSLTASEGSHGRAVVGYVADRSGPACSGVLQNCVARMRRANLDYIRSTSLPFVTRQPDAA